MSTKNKSNIITDLQASIYENTNKEVTPTKVQVPFQDIVNSISVNVTVAQLQAEGDAAEHSLANIIDPLKAGVFLYDSTDTTSVDDAGGGCIVTSTGKRYKRIIHGKIDARWYGRPNAYFATVADANTAIKSFSRKLGQSVDIMLAGTLTTHWYRDGVADGNLIPVSTGSGAPTPQVYEIWFIVGGAIRPGQSSTPLDGTNVYGPDANLDGDVVAVWAFNQNGKYPVLFKWEDPLSIDTPYFVFNDQFNTITMKNGTFNTGNYWSFQYKK